MTFRRVLSSVSLAAMLGMASIPAVLAQFGGMPGMPGMPGAGFPGPGTGPGAPATPGGGGFGSAPMGAPSGPPPACQQLIALRDERVKNLQALEGSKGKATPAEACKMFRALMTSETKFIASMKANSAQCGVPPEIIKQADEGHSRGLQVANQVCDAAEHPRPTGPTLSDVLNSSPVLPDATNTKSGQGIYDTLQGNLLAPDKPK